MKDEVEDAVDSTANMLKLTLPCNVILQVPVWSCGTPEQFITHIQQAINAIEHEGLKEAYDKLLAIKKECASTLEEVKLSLKISQDDFEGDFAQARSVKSVT
jgi:hypothetical protein